VFVTDSVLDKPKATERVHAFDEATGNHLWTHSYDVKYKEINFDPAYPTGPIGTPIVSGGRIYAGGCAGNFLCLDAEKGNVVWERDLQKEFPGLDSYASPSPLIEGDLVIAHVGIKPAASVMAFDKNTGKEVWRALDAGATASSPIIITAAGVRQMVVWTEKTVTALEPATGKTLWEVRLNTTQDAAVSTPVYRDGRLLIGGLMMKVDQEKPAAEIVWPKSRATARRVLSDTSTAVMRGDYIYSARSLGSFVCLDAGTGKQIWETDKVTDEKSGASVHPTENGDTVLLYNDRGELIRVKLSPEGYQEISRARVLEPAVTYSGRKTAWAVPAFANRHIFARTNVELVCGSLERTDK
jgi:outer membrane protein assembly factor BamB